MPWGFGGGPWWALSPEERRRFWRHGWRCWRFPWLPRGWWALPYFEFPALTKEEEIAMLEEEQRMLKEELEEIKKRLEELKGGKQEGQS